MSPKLTRDFSLNCPTTMTHDRQRDTTRVVSITPACYCVKFPWSPLNAVDNIDVAQVTYGNDPLFGVERHTI